MYPARPCAHARVRHVGRRLWAAGCAGPCTPTASTGHCPRRSPRSTTLTYLCAAPPPRWAWLRRALATRPVGRSARADRRGSRLTGRSGFRSIFRVLFISSQTFARLLLFSPDLWRRRRVAIHSRVPMSPVRVRACAMSGDGRGRRVVQGFQLQRDYRDTARVALRAHQAVYHVRRLPRARPAASPGLAAPRARDSAHAPSRAGRRRCAMGGVRARAREIGRSRVSVLFLECYL
jgi:hypothetical protein